MRLPQPKLRCPLRRARNAVAPGAGAIVGLLLVGIGACGTGPDPDDAIRINEIAIEEIAINDDFSIGDTDDQGARTLDLPPRAGRLDRPAGVTRESNPLPFSFPFPITGAQLPR